jgi:hypothetical protein
MDRIPIDYCRECNLLDACKIAYRATEPPCAKRVEAVDNSAQQLKAEIAARIQTLNISTGYGYLESLVTFLQHMRRLSAV